MKVYLVIREVYTNEDFVRETGSFNEIYVGYDLCNTRVEKIFSTPEKAQEYLKKREQNLKNKDYKIVWSSDDKVTGIRTLKDYQRKTMYRVQAKEVE